MASYTQVTDAQRNGIISSCRLISVTHRGHSIPTAGYRKPPLDPALPTPKSGKFLTVSNSHSDPTASRRAHIEKSKRVVVKLGTNVLCRESGELAISRLYGLVEDLVDAHRQGLEIILVSSGSISLGTHRLGLTSDPDSLATKQACAAIGQIQLMGTYEQAFDRSGITTAQLLLSESDFSNRGRYLNLRNTMEKLLQLRTVPIVNENDTVSTLEIETHLPDQASGGSVVFGDNDMLSALVASKLGAHLLIILSNVDGLHDKNPNTSTDSKRIRTVTQITPDIEALASGRSVRGRGGMKTKLQAARVATRSGTMTIIARGTDSGSLRQILAGNDVGTCFLPQKALSSRKRWIAFASTVTGRVRVNAGVREALLRKRASLLFAGVTALEKTFASGDIVSIVDESGEEVARGISNYSSDEATALVGRKSAEISSIRSDEPVREELIHRDNIVIVFSEESGH